VRSGSAGDWLNWLLAHPSAPAQQKMHSAGSLPGCGGARGKVQSGLRRKLRWPVTARTAHEEAGLRRGRCVGGRSGRASAPVERTTLRRIRGRSANRRGTREKRHRHSRCRRSATRDCPRSRRWRVRIQPGTVGPRYPGARTRLCSAPGLRGPPTPRRPPAPHCSQARYFPRIRSPRGGPRSASPTTWERRAGGRVHDACSHQVPTQRRYQAGLAQLGSIIGATS
jgi:hypothetical protein